MPEQEVTQESAREAEAEIDAIRPPTPAREPNSQLALVKVSIAEMNARQAERRHHDDSVKAFAKYSKKFGWTAAQFADYWNLRQLPNALRDKRSEWNKLLGREYKRIKAKPRTNENVKDMSPEDALEHRRAKVRKAVAKFRAKKKSEADADALATGKRDATDEELALLMKLEAENATPRPICTDEENEMADILASLRDAERAEIARGD